MKKRTIVALLLLFVISFCGCSQKIELLPGIDLPVSKMNQYIELVADPGGGSPPPQNDSIYFFQIRNLSDETIVFPGDYGVKLFIEQETDQWKEIENMMGYSDRAVVLPPGEKFPLGRILGILPYILDLSEAVTVRVVVVGYMESKPDKNVGAYIDILLIP